MRPASPFVALALLVAVPSAQSNANPNVDVRLSRLSGILASGREGAYPDGSVSVSVGTTVCNEGSVFVRWEAPMSERHPVIAFLLAREADGRFVQISDRSYVKHGFLSTNQDCTGCSIGPGSILGVGCSDTYAVGNNSDDFFLGPPQEIDPWLGTWDPICSHFDRSEPPVGAPADCDGVRSFGSSAVMNLGPLGHRMHVRDADLGVPGATFWAQAQYVVQTEPDAARENNLGSREVLASWDGTRWTMALDGALVEGSVLQRWNGATVHSAANGDADGRVYVGVKVSEPTDGIRRYEYAIHNRDNARGIAAFSLPLCTSARLGDISFRDLDQDPANDWSMTRIGGELRFVAPAGNALAWNTIYNIGFDSDAAPVPGTLGLLQAQGPGPATLGVPTEVPGEVRNVLTGPGCAQGVEPRLFATQSATLGNPGFRVDSTGNRPLQPNALFYTFGGGSMTLGGCTLHLGPQPLLHGIVVTDVQGRASHPAPVPLDAAFEGVEVHVQALARCPGAGTVAANWELSNGLRIRVGNAIPPCE